MFLPSEEESSIKALDGKTTDYDKGVVRINVMVDDLYSVELGVHMENYAYLFDEFFLVADDLIYLPPLRAVLPATLSNHVSGGRQAPAKGKLRDRFCGN